MEHNYMTICGLVCFLFIYFISVILYAQSFDTLQPNEAGLVYNSVFQTLDKTRVYTSGRYYVGLGKHFIKFPLSTQNIDLNGQVVNSVEKQPITINVSIQYKLKNTAKGEIVSIYNSYNSNIKSLQSQLSSLAIAAIKNACSAFSNAQFFGDTPSHTPNARSILNEEVSRAVMDSFNASYVDVVQVQVKEIDFVSINFVNSLITTVTSRQGIIKAEMDRLVQIESLKANSYAQNAVAFATVQLANAQGYGREIIANATSTGFQTLLGTQQDLYYKIVDNLKLNPSQFLQYLYLKSIKDVGASAHLVAGFDSNSGVLRDIVASSS